MIFLDTNIIGYAFLSQDTQKKECAMSLLYQAILGNEYAISTQVISESMNLLFRKSTFTPQQMMKCFHILQHIATIVQLTVPIIQRAVELKVIYGMQYYDAQIIAAAEACNANIVFSEDMANHQCYASISCVNPFA